ncbi:hypothetical protein FNF27_08221 [Cafeteria roenbergensis]|uniref:Ubiquitin-like domain-containing protein n=1 Tax=Cafeteria roenbergensis TaxID=33653 RepID=A0A5A8DA28_CAFRO|nr:hypothetical protein FNF27_08221 [Cafeteria roenbergensis]
MDDVYDGTGEEPDERTVMASSIATLAGPGVVIQFTIEPDGFIQPVEFPIETRVGALKEAIAEDMQIPAQHLVLRFLGRVAASHSTLQDCGLRNSRRIVEGNVVIDPTQTGDEYRMPRVLVVSVVNDDTGAVEREVIVRVSRASDDPDPAAAAAAAVAAAADGEEGGPEEDDPSASGRAGGGGSAAEDPWARGRKPFLGGFKDKRTGLQYHHAATQTSHARADPWAGRAPRVSRDTQTPKLVTRSAQTKRRPMLRPERPLPRRRAAEAAEQHRVMVERRMNPRTAGDFAALYGEVEAWRQAETARIKAADMSEASRKEALAQLLARQTRMLASVDGLRTQAKKDAQGSRVARMLDDMAQPQRWETGDGAVAVVHTPFSQRAAELKALYVALTTPPAELLAGSLGSADADALPDDVAKLMNAGGAAGAAAAAGGGSVGGGASSPDEAKDEDDVAASAAAAGGKSAEIRVKVLLQVKWTVKEFDCGLTREIVELIDREADLLARGRPQASLRSLRRRLGNLFLQFVETPEFNPEAARFQRVPRDLASRPNVMPIIKG